MLDFFKYIP